MKYFLKDKTSKDEAEPYDDIPHLLARLWGLNLAVYMVIITERDDKANLILDFSRREGDDEPLWLTAFVDTVDLTLLYNNYLPVEVYTNSIELERLIEELESK